MSTVERETSSAVASPHGTEGSPDRDHAAVAATLPPPPLPRSSVASHPRLMLDRYELIAEIARGGMGTVYLARLGGAGGFERLMAIKLMHEHLADEPQFVAMLLDEARTAASVHHPNAIGIVDVCASPVGYYLVMGYVEGFSLWEVITHPALEDHARIRLATRLVADALHGLHAAHTAKDAKGAPLHIVHRDVSPQNVVVGVDGLGRIADFGIALAASRMSASNPGVLKGKPGYMAPEQARGAACDARTDVFAMGVVLWEALVNDRLFWAETDVAVLLQVLRSTVERPDARSPAVPEALADVAMKALARKPSARFATARDFAVALERAAESAGLLATTHEAEAEIGRLFASELAHRRRAVAKLLTASSGAPVLLQRGELGRVPKLLDGVSLPERGPGGSGVRDTLTRPREPLALAAEREPEPDALVGPSNGTLGTPGARGVSPVLVALVALVGLAVGGLYFPWPASPASPSTTAPATTRAAPPSEPRAEAPGDPSSPPLPPPAPARGIEAPDDVRSPAQPEGALDEPGRAEAADDPPPHDRRAERGALPDPRDGERRDRPTAPRRTRAADPPTPAPALPAEPAMLQPRPPAPLQPPAPPPVSLELEQNPYLSR